MWQKIHGKDHEKVHEKVARKLTAGPSVCLAPLTHTRARTLCQNRTAKTNGSGSVSAASRILFLKLRKPGLASTSK